MWEIVLMDFEFYKLPLRKRWDFVLEWFAYNHNSKPTGSIANIVNHINFREGFKNKDYSADLWYNLKPIIDLLLKDELISNAGERRLSIEDPPFTVYSITEKGREFCIIQGGYSTVQELNDQAKSHAEQVEKAMLVNNKWMKIGTLVAAGATSCLVLIELLKHFGWILSINLLTAVVLFSSGICTGGLALLIADKVLQQRNISNS